MSFSLLSETAPKSCPEFWTMWMQDSSRPPPSCSAQALPPVMSWWSPHQALFFKVSHVDKVMLLLGVTQQKILVLRAAGGWRQSTNYCQPWDPTVSSPLYWQQRSRVFEGSPDPLGEGFSGVCHDTLSRFLTAPRGVTA